MKQLNIFQEKRLREFGGSLLLGKRKEQRPLDSKQPIHLTLKAGQDYLLLRHRKTVEEILRKYAVKFGVKIYSFAAHADHLHSNIKVPSRTLYVRWIRSVTSQIVRKVPGIKWRLRPHTRIAHWGKDLKGLKNYIAKNEREADVILEAHEIVRLFELKISAALGISVKDGLG